MAICSYLVIPEPGQAASVQARLESLPGCDVVPSLDHEILLLVTDTPDDAADRALRDRIEALDGLQSLVLTFGEVRQA
jgi:nitrate reductase NapAB chaperone NapD